MRFLGINLPETLSLSSALSRLYGIGNTKAQKICNKLGFSNLCPIYVLTDYQLNALRDEVDKEPLIELNLKKYIDSRITRLVTMNCYKGVRHRMSLPVRGQRSRTNARTQKKKHFIKIKK